MGKLTKLTSSDRSLVLSCVRKKFEPICKISLGCKIRCRTLPTNYANINANGNMYVLSQLKIEIEIHMI